MDRTEVTAAAYAECVQAGGCDRPGPYGSDLGDIFDCNYGKSLRKNHPMNCVVARAAAYCTWVGKRLPSSEEWEYAARQRRARVPMGARSTEAE